MKVLKMFLFKITRAGWGGRSPHLQTECLYDDLEKGSTTTLVFDAVLVDGAIHVKASLHV